MSTFILADDEDEGRSLLLQHAAPPKSPVNEDVLRHCLQRCHFRKEDDDPPLALEMLNLDDVEDPVHEEGEHHHSIFSVARNRFEEHPVFSILKKNFDALQKEDQMLFMDATLFYPRHDPSFTTLEWLQIVHGASAQDINARLNRLKEKSFLQSFNENTIAIHELWREFAVTQANAANQEWLYDNNDQGESIFRESLRRAFIWRRTKLKQDLAFALCTNLITLTLRNVPLVSKTLDVAPLQRLKYLEIQLHGNSSALLTGLGSLKNLVILRWFNIPPSSPYLQEISLLINLQILELHFLPYKQTDTTTFHQLDFTRLNLLRIFAFISPGEDSPSYYLPSVPTGLRALKNAVEDFDRILKHGYYTMNDKVILLERFCKFHVLQRLENLDISRCGFIMTLTGLEELVSLVVLRATRCSRLKEVPSLRKLQKLQKLEVSFCVSITALPGLDEAVNLVEIDARGCYKLMDLPSLQNLQQLRKLDLSVCGIKALPGLDEVVSLQELHLGGCSHLEEIPSLEKLQQLQKMQISWCPLIQALPGLEEVVNLGELHAQDCLKLGELPDVRKLTRMQVLNLKIAQYFQEKFPDAECFPDEERTYNSVTIKGVPGVDGLVSLVKLTVDFEVFEGAPDLGKLTNLRKLSIRGWSAGAAKGVATLPNLQVLRISYSVGLRELVGISDVRALRRLKFYRCDFESVSCLGGLAAFQHLHVKAHGDAEDGYACLKKLLVSVLESARFSVYVDVENYCWMYVWDEVQKLEERGLVVHPFHLEDL